MFIFRVMYFHYAMNFWHDWKMWVIGLILAMPVAYHVAKSGQVFYASYYVECPINSSDGQFKEQNAEMESLLG